MLGGRAVSRHVVFPFGRPRRALICTYVLLTSYPHVGIRHSPWWLPQTQGWGRRGWYCQEVSPPDPLSLSLVSCFSRKKKKSKSKSDSAEKKLDPEQVKELLQSDELVTTSSGSGRDTPNAVSSSTSSSSRKTEAEKRFEEVQRKRVCYFVFTTVFSLSSLVLP